ncbi:MAG: hypothetical protein MJ175_12100, partial [Clostridia bacterium]|nr:hypothetical protein [Clostridia bacterium]
MRKHTAKMAWLLLLVTAGSIFTASCGDTASNTPVQTQANNDSAAVTEPVDTAELTELEMRKLISDGLTDEDFGGKAFRIIMESERVEEMWTDEQIGEACNDSIYMRNSKIESRFNVKFSVIEQVDKFETVNFFKTMVLGGADDAELGAYNDYVAYTPVGAGCCMNWVDIPNVDLSRPWHNKLANDGATINGKLFTLCSDLSVSSMTYTYGIFFNTRLTTNYDMT